jgi:C-methyltransferase C-terminal domain/Putative zinc binding domain/Methyltransferase domain
VTMAAQGVVLHDEADGGSVAAGCRFCEAPLTATVVDLGKSPLCQTILDADDLNRMEPFYPLHVQVCQRCWLVQVEEYVDPEGIFARDYPYFSSYSDSWLTHARRYVDDMVRRWDLGPHSQVVELGSNDGYMLQYVVERGIPALGIEPAANVAKAAQARGVTTEVAFFGDSVARDLRARGIAADLVAGKNVMAQVPDLNDFVAGIATLLAPHGVCTIEFPHLVTMIEHNEFDTIYHEHFSYFSFVTVERVFAAHGLRLFDVQELPTHGGSLRIFACHDGASHQRQPAADELAARERRIGVESVDYYDGFAQRVRGVKRQLLRFLIDAAERGEQVVGYGAPGKGNTLLNYCGIRSDLLAYTVDRNPAKQGRFLPGTHIGVHHPDHIAETRPDHVLILPWNLKDEIAAQLSYVREWGGNLVVPIPGVQTVEPHAADAGRQTAEA